MEDAHITSPNTVIEIKYAYEDGETVITQPLFLKKTWIQPWFTFLMFSGSKIIELWALGEPIYKNSPNQNGLF